MRAAIFAHLILAKAGLSVRGNRFVVALWDGGWRDN
jgi:hypothetical protein